MRISINSNIEPDTTRRALVFLYRTRWTENFGNRYVQRAIALLQQAASAGNSSAMNFLGIIHGEGWGRPENLSEAANWFQQAADLGHPVAMYNLAICFDNGYGLNLNKVEAWKLYLRSAQKNSSAAMLSLASMYYRGEGIMQDFQRARYWYRRCARLNNPAAMYELGRCYQDGLGGSVRLSAAVFWFKKAIKQGESRAMLALGTYYCKQALPPDFSKALSWYEAAVEKVDTKVTSAALYQLGLLARQGHISSNHSPNAVEYFQWAAKFGHQGAMIELALLADETF